jgi:glycosyltransferase involved in cell wall biosynthesis
MQALPGVRRHYRAFLPFYPNAIESLDLREYDLVISSSSAFAKSAVTRPDAVHVCYCHTPMRFAWSFDNYVARERLGAAARVALPPLMRWLRAWDVRTATRATHFVANSTVVRERIRQCYEREAEVVFPPVGVQRFDGECPRDDYHLVVSRLSAYKRVDLAVQAFTRLGRRLHVIGDGPDRAALERTAGPTVSFLGRLRDEEVAGHYARARALVFPGEEDFGIVPLEANAAGCPVIAYGSGGARDTVIDGRTGVLFHEQTVESLIEAVERADTLTFDRAALREHAGQFDEARFRRQFAEVVDRAMAAA